MIKSQNKVWINKILQNVRVGVLRPSLWIFLDRLYTRPNSFPGLKAVMTSFQTRLVAKEGLSIFAHPRTKNLSWKFVMEKLLVSTGHNAPAVAFLFSVDSSTLPLRKQWDTLRFSAMRLNGLKVVFHTKNFWLTHGFTLISVALG